MKPIVAYCRSANEPLDGPSCVRSQAEAIREYAERRGLTLGSIYADAGVSGVTLDRPALQQLIADCRAGKIGTVITKDPDRLSRDFRQFIALLHIFQTTGVRVEYIGENVKPTALSKPPCQRWPSSPKREPTS